MIGITGRLLLKPPPNIKVHINSKTRRVFNGMKTTIKMFPFIVSIHIMGEFACAGSIISRDIIITAATCLQESYSNRSKLNPKSIYVRLGSDYITSDGETIPVQDLHFHPDYDSDILRNNLVLIRLEKRIRFSKQQPLIRRIEYDTARQGLDPDEEGVLILGWGATKEDQTVNVNQKLTMDDLDQFQWDTCKDLYSEDYVNAENFCAAKINKRGGACNGDVGGPGVIGPKLMGIISFGAPVCGSTDAPTVFTKLGYYADWINSVLKSKPERRSAMTYPSRIARRNISDTQLMSRIYESIQSARSKFRGRDEYPEEVTVLKEILSELVKSNTGMVDELMYGDLYADFNEIFEGSEKLPVSQHVLVNKSLYPIPEVHYDAPREYLTVTLTTSHTKSRLAKIGGSTPSNGLGRAIKPIGVESSGHHNSDESVSSKEAIAHELSVELLSSSSNTKIKHQETKHKKYTAHDKHREHEKTKKPAPPTTTTSKAHFSTSKDKIFDKIRIASNDKNENIGNMFYNLFDKGINVIKKTFSNNIFSTAENDKDNVNSSKKNSKSIIVHENDKDNNIHSRNQNDMIINVDNYKLTVNRINQSYDDEYDESVYDIDVDESESESETEEKHSVQSKKTTVKTKSKSHSKKETSNVGKKKMYSGKKTIRTSNKNSQESEDYSYTKHPEAVGTQMNLWYNL
ncbi:unnamed protein product [Chrysodeixis includens]|uniref:Peptidase S1 domain-containing protein n=1 Tax=Chrysodeixis includens TaxID=689277 RepID=A0A9P0FVU9_CHRIL|nr:unnamed protein product [Chrysodeixis includens]